MSHPSLAFPIQSNKMTIYIIVMLWQIGAITMGLVLSVGVDGINGTFQRNWIVIRARVIIPTASTTLKKGTLVSPCLSIRPSVCLSVDRIITTVSSIIPAGSISYNLISGFGQNCNFLFWQIFNSILHLVFSYDQAAIWLVQSVRPSVCLSVCHTFFTMFPSSYHHEIFRSYYHGQKWCPCKRSKVKVTEVNTQLSRFRTLTPVWIHIWQWNHAHSWKQHRRGALLFFQGHPSNFKVTRL